MAEIGRIGQNRYGGRIQEEFLPELQGISGVRTYREMADNDSVIGAILFAIKMLIRNTTWTVEPGGDSAKDREAAEFIDSCRDDMSQTWTDFISECLSFLTYGWSLHEVVYKHRMGKKKDPELTSKYSDGLIGWAKLPIRAQETLYEWEYDDKDNLIAMTQQPPPDFGLYTIPMKKALLFRTESNKDNPEGRSILRNSYRAWYFKRRIEEIEAVGIERDLAGLPVVHAPEGVDIWNSKDPKIRQIYGSLVGMVKNVRRDEYEGLVLPFGYEFSLVSTAGTRQFDTNAIIQRYNTQIAMTVLADFLMLGHEGTGSFALSEDKTELFSDAISTYLDTIAEVFNNKAIPMLIDANGGHFEGIEDYPKLTHSEVEQVDLTKMAAFINQMVGSGVIIPDADLEDYLRKVAKLPERSENAQTDISPERQSQREETGNPQEEEEEDPEPAEDEIEQAAKRLGR